MNYKKEVTYEDVINELLIPFSYDYLRERRMQIYACKHEFLKMRPYSFEEYYIPPTVECLKCGLTNKYIEKEEELEEERYYGINTHGINYEELTNYAGKLESMETYLFKEYFPTYFKLRDDELEYISDEAIDTTYGRLLKRAAYYRLASDDRLSNLKIKIDNDEIFQMMKHIYNSEPDINKELKKQTRV